jgi:hypothetical protein
MLYQNPLYPSPSSVSMWLISWMLRPDANIKSHGTISLTKERGHNNVRKKEDKVYRLSLRYRTDLSFSLRSL